MIPPSTVQLTRVHFYDPSRNERNVEIPSVSREVFRYDLDKNRVIKKNIFGHKWVLKINENQDVKKKKCSGKVIVYVWVFCCIIIAICFGIYFSIGKCYLIFLIIIIYRNFKKMLLLFDVDFPQFDYIRNLCELFRTKRPCGYTIWYCNF